MNGEYLVGLYHGIWSKYKSTSLNRGTQSSHDNLLDRGFVFQFDEEIKDVDVLFVGINPSYQHGSPKNEELFYTKEQALQHSYFKPFRKIGVELKEEYDREISWTHLDMLVFKETQQSFIRDHLFRSQTGVEFIVDQLEVSREILEHIQPRVMVVSNTMARELLGRNRVIRNDGEVFGIWMGLEFTFDKNIGTDVIVNHPTLSGTKVFFTSMLSGQRALDNGTKQRLIWHINEVLKLD